MHPRAAGTPIDNGNMHQIEKPYSLITQKNLEKGKLKFFSLVFDYLF